MHLNVPRSLDPHELIIFMYRINTYFILTPECTPITWSPWVNHFHVSHKHITYWALNVPRSLDPHELIFMYHINTYFIVHSGVNKVCVYQYILMIIQGNQVIAVHSGVNKCVITNTYYRLYQVINWSGYIQVSNKYVSIDTC